MEPSQERPGRLGLEGVVVAAGAELGLDEEDLVGVAAAAGAQVEADAALEQFAGGGHRNRRHGHVVVGASQVGRWK
jgi:hypothetical protein